MFPKLPVVDEGKTEDVATSRSAETVEISAITNAIEAFNEQADGYLQQAGELQRQAAVGQVAIEVRGAVNLVRIAVARADALAAIERARFDALSQVQNTTVNRQGTNPTMNG